MSTHDLKAALDAVSTRVLALDEVRALLPVMAERGVADPLTFSGLACDSRAVHPGDLFVAMHGEKVDGHHYLREAWERGARAAVVETLSAPHELPQLQVADARRALSRLSDAAFGEPSSHLTCIGITGTKGKTSTSYYLAHLLAMANHRAGVLGTLGLHVSGTTLPLPLTTPESIDIHRALASMRDLGCSHACLEVSAHGIHFQRSRDIRFSRGVFTNLAQDHLDFFGTMDRYGATKQRFFTEQLMEQPEGLAVINSDDPVGGLILAALDSGRAISYGLGREAMVRGQLLGHRPEGLLAHITLHDGAVIEVLAPVAGLFNLSNLLAAAAVAESLGVAPEAIAAGLATLPPVPGRHEVVSTRADDITVVVDYAHTPASVAAILATAERGRHGPVIALVGCGGDRDRGKRPQMGLLACEASDHLTITSDNPRTEEPDSIIREILSGIPPEAQESKVTVEPDRAIAIATTIAEAPTGALIYLLGKGHETYQILRDKTIAFDDREHARNALAARREARVGVTS